MLTRCAGSHRAYSSYSTLCLTLPYVLCTLSLMLQEPGYVAETPHAFI